MSAHWFSVLQQEIPELRTHLLTLDLPPKLNTPEFAPLYKNRVMQVKKLKILPVESIVRGYITGSAWSSYTKTGLVNDLKMPADLQESQKLEQPLWTPSTKAELGEKDENISPKEASKLIGADYAKKIEVLSLQIYARARDYAAARGIIIADTKFEFGVDEDGEVVLADEVLTPDSSRFWDAKKYQVGRPQDSLDKQYLRDWLTSTGQKGKEGVAMTLEVAERTKKGYQEAFERLVEKPWESFI
ncbi:hypothetical protein FH972_024236 [Carpinus fangiana]|uniref:phosphoribosylaminoimidazolesuccinocarboxamide synthase n=1 Tax=Carpinus fangiana TaxID=176857 RepID=A0A5N6KZZ8_9ROSI|nr:hypothetical protein FH972_024236 [Carpinus fangiana]